MKKAIFSVMMAFLLVCASLSSFGQKTDTRIYNIIQMSKEHNAQYNGINDPNKIWPGQTLDFFFEDGTLRQIIVKKGDTESDLIREIIELEKEHGPVIAYPVEDTLVPPTPQAVPISASVQKDSSGFMDFLQKMPWWAWVIIALFFIGLIGSLVEASKKKKEFKHSDNPATEGKPFVEGGITSENAEEHMRHLMEERNPGSVITVKNIKAGYLSTPNGVPAIVEFANNTKQNLTFRNSPGFSGEVSIDDKPFSLEYFFQGCGNPAYGRTSMKSGIIFSKDPIDFGDEIQPIAETVTTKETTTVEAKQDVKREESVPQTTNPGSEPFQVALEHSMIVEEFLKTQVAHKVTMEYITPEGGTVKTIFETKNVLSDKKADEK